MDKQFTLIAALPEQGEGFFVVLGVDLDFDAVDGGVDRGVGGGLAEDLGRDVIVPEHAGGNLGDQRIGEPGDGFEFFFHHSLV